MFEEHTGCIKRAFLCSGEQYFENQQHLHFTTQQLNREMVYAQVLVHIAYIPLS